MPTSSDNPLIIEPDTERSLDLACGMFDIGGEVVASFVEIDVQPNAELVDFEPCFDDSIILTGLCSGTGEFTYAIADDDGARSVAHNVHFEVNAPPKPKNDVAAVGTLDGSLLIDAIANDGDPDDTISYPLDETDKPVALDAGLVSILAFGSTLLGEVTLSEAEHAFLYTAPNDPALFGKTDQFLYDVVDDDGATARASVLIELISEEVGININRFGSSDHDQIQSFAGSEVFLL